MRKLTFIIIMAFTILNISSCAQMDTLPDDIGEKVISAEGLKTIIESKDTRFVIVDVRPESAYKAGHIPTAINIPDGLSSNVKNPPPKDKYIILYCFVGFSSRTAGGKMIDDGYKYILVWGGIRDWPYDLEKLE